MSNKIKYTMDFYLKDKDHPEAIKRMMKQLYKGKSKTMTEWETIDKNMNERRC